MQTDHSSSPIRCKNTNEEVNGREMEHPNNTHMQNHQNLLQKDTGKQGWIHQIILASTQSPKLSNSDSIRQRMRIIMTGRHRVTNTSHTLLGAQQNRGEDI